MKQNKNLPCVSVYKRLGVIGFLCLVLVSGTGCTHNDASNAESVKQIQSKEAIPLSSPTIAMINNHPSDYEGMKLSLSGVFKGWKGRCKGSPPVSRSDWMLADNSACIYISGAMPAGLQAMFPHDEAITITGTVRLTQAGKAYIEAR